MSTFIGIDLGGTKVLGAKVSEGNIIKEDRRLLPTDNGDQNVVIDLIVDVINLLIDDTVEAIGIGVPSMVDPDNGIVYDVQNIPSWKEVHIVDILKKHFNIPIYIGNDANCYALGEAYFGKGIDSNFFVGITIGTGLGAGIVYKRNLLEDSSGASGEFGIVPYLDGVVEDYCSGHFFHAKCGKPGDKVAELARQGDIECINAYKEFGMHLGNAIKIVMATVDPDRIIIGGSVAQSKEFFMDEMLETIKKYPFPRSVENLQLTFSNTNNMSVLGAASLCFNVE